MFSEDQVDTLFRIGVTAALGFMVTAAAFCAQWIMLMFKHKADKERHRKTEKVLDEINDAVNHRHQRTDANGDTPPKLYDVVLENRERIKELSEWREGYKGSAFGDSGDINDYLTRTDKRFDRLEENVQGVHECISELKDRISTRPCMLENGKGDCPEGY